MKYTTENFIKKAREVHGNKYGYEKTICNRYNDYVIITCPAHGDVRVKAKAHLNGHMCPKCAKEIYSKPKTKDNFIKQAKNVYGDKYDYSNVNYVNNYTEIDIICPSHGEFKKLPYNFLNGSECPKCTAQKNKIIFESKMKEMYADKYDLSKLNYIDADTNVCVICPIHGEIWRKPSKFLDGNGCYKCAQEKQQVERVNECFNASKKYTTEMDFRINDYKNFIYAKKKGIFDKMSWIKPLDNDSYEKTHMHSVYVYEFDNNIAYVGLTNCIERRHYEHSSPLIRNKENNDFVFQYAKKNNTIVPEPKILFTNLTPQEAKKTEIDIIQKYKKEGWCLINHNRGGSLGFVPHNKIIDENTIINIAKQYTSPTQLQKNNNNIYNNMLRLNLLNVCFPNRKHKPHKSPEVYTEEYIKDIVAKYPQKKNLRKYEVNMYMWLVRHKRLYDYYERDIQYNKKN